MDEISVPKTIIKFAKKNKWSLFFGLFIDYLLSYYIAIIVNNTIYKILIDKLSSNTFSFDRDYLIIIFYVLTLNCGRLITAFLMKLRYRFKTVMKEDVKSYYFQHSIKKSINFFNNNIAGALMSKVANISDYSVNILEISIRIVAITIIALMLIINFSKVNILLSIFLVIWVFVYSNITYFIMSRTKKISKESSRLRIKSMGIMTDSFLNISNIKTFLSEKYEKSIIKKYRIRILESVTKGIKIHCTFLVFDYFFIALAVFVAAYISISMNIAEKITIGECVFIISSFSMIVFKISEIVENFVELSEMYGSMEEALDIIATKPEIVDCENAKKLKNIDGGIIFRNVNFSFKKGIK